MNKLTNARASTFDYKSRYTGVYYYYDEAAGKDIYGIGHQIRFDTPYALHKVRGSDTLDKLALTYYNNPSYWWVIAYFNKINDPFISLPLKYKTLKIPAISSIIFED
jgi:hypothetical protein